MKENLRVSAVYCCSIFIIAALAGCQGSGPSSNQPITKVWNFDKEKIGSIPAGWEAAETNGKGKVAVWQIIKDNNAQSGSQTLAITETQNTGRTFNLIIAKGTSYKDLEISVWVKACSWQRRPGWRTNLAGKRPQQLLHRPLEPIGEKF